MKAFILPSLLALGLSLPAVSQAVAGTAAPAPSTAQGVVRSGPKPQASTAIVPQVSGRSIIMCYTCGGNYPSHVATASLGGSNNVWEWGSGCGGTQTWRSDSAPYMCAH